MPADQAHPKNSLFMVARDKSAGAATSMSTDGGETWTDFETDTSLPSYNIARAFFASDSTGQYLYVYNAGTGASNRDILNYRTRRPGGSWSTPKLFANGPAGDNTDQPDGKGWDNYPMADEYAPGKFWVVWEFDTTRVRTNRLDISDTPSSLTPSDRHAPAPTTRSRRSVPTGAGRDGYVHPRPPGPTRGRRREGPTNGGGEGAIPGGIGAASPIRTPR